MAQYIENFTQKLDWSIPFQRTLDIPLERSSIFSSYDDLILYAKKDGSDSRGLGKTSYVGQLVVVYSNTEVSAYIITSVGNSPSVMKLAQTTPTGNVTADISALQSAVSSLDTRVKALEDEPRVVDTDTQYLITTATTTDGAVSVQVTDKQGQVTETYEVQVKGWQSLVDLATGRSSAYVYANKTDSRYLVDIKTRAKFNIGDIIYFTDTDIEDEWVTEVLSIADETGVYYTFSELESSAPDLKDYLTLTAAATTYATKAEVATKASAKDVSDLTDTVSTLSSTVETNKNELTSAINKVAEDLANIDVGNQIDVKIGELDAAQVGNVGQYIQSIQQVDGKIIAVAEAMPDVEHIADTAATTALNDAKSYVEQRLEIPTDTTVKTYVDTEIQKTNTEVTSVAARVKIIEDKNYDQQIATINSTLSDHTTQLGQHSTAITELQNTTSNHGSRIQVLENTSTQHTTQISELQANVASRVKTIELGGVAQTMTAQGVVNITQISTDLLVTGKNTLVLDCLNASLVDEA